MRSIEQHNDARMVAKDSFSNYNSIATTKNM